MSEQVEVTDEAFNRILRELGYRKQVEPMSDRALIAELTLAYFRVGVTTFDGVVINEAIDRLKRYDIQRRWDERRARRANVTHPCRRCGAAIAGRGGWPNDIYCVFCEQERFRGEA